MNGTHILSLLAGAALGAFVTWRFAKAHYERIVQTEIESVKNVFTSMNTYKECESDVESAVFTEDDINEYDKLINQEGYKTSNEQEASENMDIYVISPDEFAENDDYDQATLTYYADDVLTDENDEVIDTPEDIIGDALDHFGEYEDDTVFVRNDALGIDYEVCKDRRNYRDVVDPDWGVDA